jgi:hypothetical protein
MELFDLLGKHICNCRWEFCLYSVSRESCELYMDEYADEYVSFSMVEAEKIEKI